MTLSVVSASRLLTSVSVINEAHNSRCGDYKLPQPLPMSEGRRRAKSVKKQEQRVARDHGGSRVPFSGAGLDKGDGRVRGKYRIENKQTAGKGYRLSVDTWDKLRVAALSAGEMPVLQVTLTDKLGRPLDLVVLGYHDYLALLPEDET